MTIQGVCVAKCPFCEGSYVNFNIVAFEAWRSRHKDRDIPRNLAEVS